MKPRYVGDPPDMRQLQIMQWFEKITREREAREGKDIEKTLSEGFWISREYADPAAPIRKHMSASPVGEADRELTALYEGEWKNLEDAMRAVAKLAIVIKTGIDVEDYITSVPDAVMRGRMKMNYNDAIILWHFHNSFIKIWDEKCPKVGRQHCCYIHQYGSCPLLEKKEG